MQDAEKLFLFQCDHGVRFLRQWLSVLKEHTTAAKCFKAGLGVNLGWAIPALLAFVIGILTIPALGLQADELLYTTPWFDAHILHRWMLLPYLGSLKSWLYWPLHKAGWVSIWAVRLPSLIIGCATVVIFFHFLKVFFRLASRSGNAEKHLNASLSPLAVNPTTDGVVRAPS